MTVRLFDRSPLLAAVAGLAVLLAFPLVETNPYYIHLLETVLVYAILLVGLDIVVGYTGQVSLGQFLVARVCGPPVVFSAVHLVCRDEEDEVEDEEVAKAKEAVPRAVTR